MGRYSASLFRITTRTAFLAAALFLGLIFWFLPALLNLDAYRPQLTDVLEATFHCKVIVGNVTGQLVPYPGLMVGHVVFLETSKAPRVLASVNSVRLRISAKNLLKGHLRVESIRFSRPRFIAHHQPASSETRWKVLTLPRAESSNGESINNWEIRNGSIEIWDHAATPTSKWVADQFNGTFQVRSQTGALAGKVARLGPRAILNIHYDGEAAFPVQAQFKDASLSPLQFLVPARLFTLEGTADILAQARFEPALSIHAELDQPAGAGHVTVSADAGIHGPWRWSALGKHALVKGTSFQLPEWSAKGDAQGLAVYVRAASPDGAMAEVGWTKPHASDAALQVDVSSMTLRQILEIFKIQSKSAAAPGHFNPFGYESWRISRGSMEALIHNKKSFEVKDSDVDLEGMHLDLAGTFDGSAHLQGGLQNIPMTQVVESFFAPPSPITGTGRADFTLTFPLSAKWVNELNGPVQLEVTDGVLRELKTIYRIFSVLNLGNYLRLRLPQVTAQGIVFSHLAGHLTFQNGVLLTEDLFLKSPDMNVGVKGSLHIPGKHVEMTLRLEMFRFLEDILKFVPITHWIFKKPNKIFLPLVVTVEGPWDNVEIR